MLRKTIEENVDDVEVSTRPEYGGGFAKIEVSWVVDGNKEVVWSKNRGETNSNHLTIVDLLKKSR